MGAMESFRSQNAKPNTLTIMGVNIPTIAHKKLKSWSNLAFISALTDSTFCSVLMILSRSSSVKGISLVSATPAMGKNTSKNTTTFRIAFIFKSDKVLLLNPDYCAKVIQKPGKVNN
jgi:hypothetical protein